MLDEADLAVAGRPDGGHVGMVGFDLGDRDQWKADVAYLLEQAIQRGLVDDRTMDEGRAVAVVGQGQPVKPGGPSGIEVPPDADFVPSAACVANSSWV